MKVAIVLRVGHGSSLHLFRKPEPCENQLTAHTLQKCVLLLTTHTSPFVCIILSPYSNQSNPVITPAQTAFYKSYVTDTRVTIVQV